MVRFASESKTALTVKRSLISEMLRFFPLRYFGRLSTGLCVFAVKNDTPSGSDRVNRPES